MTRVMQKAQADIQDLERRKKKILADMQYLATNKITLMREGVMSPAELKLEADKLKGEPKEVGALLSAQSDSVEEMLDFLLRFSELLKNSSLLYKYATEYEKRQIVHAVFSERTFTNETSVQSINQSISWPAMNRKPHIFASQKVRECGPAVD